MRLSLLILSILLLPTLTLAQSDYLVAIPGLETDGTDFNKYINTVYAMFIGIAALLAVVKIIIAGVKYMFSDIVTEKSTAKKDIKGALLGLVIVLAAVLILTVINDDLVEFDFKTERLVVGEAIPYIIPPIEEQCASSATCGQTTNDAGVVTNILIDTEATDRASTISQAMQGCSNSSGTGIIQREQSGGVTPTYTFTCSQASETGVDRLLDVVNSGPTLPADTSANAIISDRFVDLYERFVMPFEVTADYASDPEILFAVDVSSGEADFAVINTLCDSTETKPGLIYGTWPGGILEGTGAVLERNTPPAPWVCRIPSP